MPTPHAEHLPVLVPETMDLLAVEPGMTCLDLTLGAGGHSRALLEASAPDGIVYSIDRDPRALEIAGERLAGYGDRSRRLRGNYQDLLELMRGQGVERVDRIVADLGVSSMQLDDPERGFSFRHDARLDMRMDPDSGQSAEELLAEASESELTRILRDYGEEKRARAIARAIVAEREREPIRTTGRLAGIVEEVQGPRARMYRIHPATRTFMALRVAINSEVDGLEQALRDAVDLLATGGRIAVIGFHSLELRIVKSVFRDLADRCRCPPGLPVCGCGNEDVLRLLTRRAVKPGDAELAANPRSRSAMLRAAEKR